MEAGRKADEEVKRKAGATTVSPYLQYLEEEEEEENEQTPVLVVGSVEDRTDRHKQDQEEEKRSARATAVASYLQYLEEGGENEGVPQPSQTVTVPPLPGQQQDDGGGNRQHHQQGATEEITPGAFRIAGIDAPADGGLQEQRTIVIGDGGTGAGEGGSGAAAAAAAGAPPTTSDDIDGLVEARRVTQEDEDDDALRMEEAQPVYQEQEEVAAFKKAAKDKDTKAKRLGCCLIVVAFLVLVLSLSFGNENNEPSTTYVPGTNKEATAPPSSPTTTMAPSSSPNRTLPPLENLELLYYDLPEKTKDSLYDQGSHQYKAWVWLLNHPNLTTYPEWRKKQLFAMVTFYLAYEGPNWPLEKQGKWMNYSVTNECSWVLSNDEVAYFTYASANSDYGPEAYTYKDYLPCNPEGKLQTIILHQLYNMPANATPQIPPEIELLTSLRIFANIYSQLPNVYLEDLIPELTNLPNLVHLTFQKSGMDGPIPESLGLMTTLRHLGIGANQLTGTVPAVLSNLTNLEYLSIGEMEITGVLPTELGLMTKLTYLCFGMNTMTGTIPSELGLLTNNERLYLQKNFFTGTIPTALGNMNATTQLYLHQNELTGDLPSQLGLMTGFRGILDASNNDLTGSIPTELALMSNMTKLRLGNDLQAERGSTDGNNFSGFLPSQTWQLFHLEELFLSNLPNLGGSIPSNLDNVTMPHLRLLNLNGSDQFSGILPESLCWSLDELDFTCSQKLCGCDCRCPGR